MLLVSQGRADPQEPRALQGPMVELEPRVNKGLQATQGPQVRKQGP